MKNLVTIVLSLLPFVGISQSTPNSNQAISDNLFDQVVKADLDYKIKMVTKVPTAAPSAATKEPAIIYNSEMELWDNKLKDILDNPKYKENEKINFIQSALSDESRDAFKYVSYRSIDFWMQSARARELMDAYFREKQLSETDDHKRKYRHFEFKTKNLYPDTYELIIEYFENRPDLDIRYKHEGDLIYRLIQLDKSQEALDYLDIIINEYVNGDIKHLPLMGSRDGRLYNSNVFDMLCLSDDHEVRKRGTDLLFYLLENKDYNTSDLYKLTTYLNLDRHIKLLEKRFEYYSTVDFSPLKGFKTNPEIERNRYKLMPEAESFYSYMFANSIHLGKTKGREVWKKFKETMPFWELYGQSIGMCQMYILENCFQDKSLTQEEKIQMLKEAQTSERYYRSRDLFGSYKSRYLNLIVNTFPDKIVSKELYDQLGWSDLLKYSSPLKITDSDLVIYPFRKNLEPNQIDEIVQDLNEYAENSNSVDLTLSEIDRFLYSLETPESFIFNFFQKMNKMSWFDAESASIPTNYEEFYKLEFQKLIESNSDIRPKVISKSSEIGNLYSYEIYVSINDLNYKHEYKEHGTDWYDPQRLVKMINLGLIEANEDNRLVGVDSGDQTAIFIFGKPHQIRSLLSKYNINCWAINYGDQFQNQ